MEVYSRGKFGSENFVELGLNLKEKIFAMVMGFDSFNKFEGSYENGGDNIALKGIWKNDPLSGEQTKYRFDFARNADTYQFIQSHDNSQALFKEKRIEFSLNQSDKLERRYALDKNGGDYVAEPLYYTMEPFEIVNIIYGDEDKVIFSNKAGIFIYDILKAEIVDSFYINFDVDNYQNFKYNFYKVSADAKNVYAFSYIDGGNKKDQLDLLLQA